MMKRTRALLVLGSFLLILSALIYIYVSFSSSQKTKENKTRETHVYDSSLKDIVLTEDKRYVLVSPKYSNWQPNDVSVSKNYAISTIVEYEWIYSHNNEKTSNSIIKFEVLVYDLHDEKFKERRIDLKKAIENYDSSYTKNDDLRIKTSVASYQNNTDYLQIFVSRNNKDKDKKAFLLNLKTDQIVESNEHTKEEAYRQNLFPTMDETNLNDILNLNGFSLSNELFYTNNKEKNEIREDINFNNEFPELTSRIKKNWITKILYRKEIVPPSDYYEDLRHWFAPVGQDKLDIIGKDFDTQVETPLNTYQEFIDWSVARSEKQDERMKSHGEKTD